MINEAEVNHSFCVILWELLILENIFEQFWVLVNIYLRDCFLTFFTFRKCLLIFILLLIWIHFLIHLLSLLLLATSLSLLLNLQVTSPHRFSHLSDKVSVFTEHLMIFDFFFLDEVKAIVLTLSKIFLDFSSILAPVDVKDEFVFSEDMIGIERTSGLFWFLIFLEHLLSLIIIWLYLTVITASIYNSTFSQSCNFKDILD